MARAVRAARRVQLEYALRQRRIRVVGERSSTKDRDLALPPQQNRLDLRHHLLRSGPELLAGKLSDRMLSQYDRICGSAPHLRHRPSGKLEYVGAYRNRGYSSLFCMDSVVHTARAARPSTAYCDYDIVAVSRHIAYYARIGGFGRRWLAVIDDIRNAIILS